MSLGQLQLHKTAGGPDSRYFNDPVEVNGALVFDLSSASGTGAGWTVDNLYLTVYDVATWANARFYLQLGSKQISGTLTLDDPDVVFTSETGLNLVSGTDFDWTTATLLVMLPVGTITPLVDATIRHVEAGGTGMQVDRFSDTDDDAVVHYMLLSWEDDHHGRWSKEKTISMGAVGDEDQVRLLSPMGRYRTRQYQIVIDGAGQLGVFGLEEQIIGLGD